MQARTGRENQRYKKGKRLVAGCVPIRFSTNPSISDSPQTSDWEQLLQILCVQSVNRGDWILPKGGWESDESAVEAAKRETFEEAGVEGEIIAEIGSTELVSRKGKTSEARFFVLLVSVEHEEYAETNRARQWITYEEARKLLRDDFWKIVEGVTQEPAILSAWKAKYAEIHQ